MKNLFQYFPPSVSLADFLLGSLLLLYPVALFAIPGGMNGALFLVAAISLVLLITRRGRGNHAFDAIALPFSIAMGSGMLVVLISQLYHNDLAGRYFDSNARFLLAVPVLLALRQLDMKVFRGLQYAFPLGAIAAFVMVMINDPRLYYAETSFLNHIHLGDMALLLGFLSVFGVGWFGQDRFAVKALKVTGLLAGLVVSVISSARGGWAAIPVMVAVYIYARNRDKFLSRLLLALLAICGALLLSYLFVRPVHERLWMIYSDLASYSAGMMDTSLGIRIQLWKAAAHMIADNPLLGVGADGFGRAMDGLAASGVITPQAATFGKGEVHNEILAQTVRFGIFGLCFILSVYFVPFYLFLKAVKSATANHPGKVAAMMGMCVTLSFFVFGLTVEIYDLKLTAAFYSLTVTALLAASYNRHRSESMHPDKGNHHV